MLFASLCLLSFSAVADDGSRKLYPDAGIEAQAWSLKNPGIAVGVILGSETNFTPQQVESGLRRSFAEAGVTELAFFFEQNDKPSTIVVYCYSGGTDGPFLLGKSQAEAKKSAKQYLFQQSNPALRYEYPR